MRQIVVDTNCLLMSLPSHSPYHKLWTDFLQGEVAWCVTTEILSEYMEKLEEKTTPWLAETTVNTIVNNPLTKRVSPTFFFQLIQADTDDNKFVDCAICGNAEYIVSNDNHFNILNTVDFPKVTVVRIEDYCNSDR